MELFDSIIGEQGKIQFFKFLMNNLLDFFYKVRYNDKKDRPKSRLGVTVWGAESSIRY